MLLTVFSCAGCGQDQDELNVYQGVVNLDKKVELPPQLSQLEQNSFKVAVAAIISPRGTAESYNPLLEYLGEKLNKKIILIQRRTYREINQLIIEHKVDLAFICTGAYVTSPDKNSMSLLAIPQVHGKTTYQSYIIVPEYSEAKNLDDLQGKTFAFTDPISNTGYLYPLFLLQTRQQTPETFFKRTIFTYSHDRSIQAVVSRVADGAAVDNLVYLYAIANTPEVKEKTKIIHTSQEFGMPPVVVSAHTDAAQKRLLKTIFLDMHQTANGIKALETLNIDKFVVPNENLYKKLYSPN
ncbi:MAG: phosphate/phosphite/phosphonate ABC transporter substrate-binding protein [Desulfobulbaceae bacterium]|nr:phosphate/phosphite/phosphonate ABC transporter substrate-binding protein [Desulfobulbaceae bacterium]